MTWIALNGASFHDEDTASTDRLRQQILEAHHENKAKLILLEPREGAAGIDHEFVSQTFDPRIREHLENYLPDDTRCN